MKYKRLYIIRKDLHMSSGKIAAQLSHCSEIFWLRMIKRELFKGDQKYYSDLILEPNLVEGYIKGAITKTVCQAKNKNQLMKAKTLAENCGLVEGEDFGFVNDNCLTELTPENADGTTTTAFWTAPIPESIAKQISCKYNLYTDDIKLSKWIEEKGILKCSKCGETVEHISKYCPNCGAPMQIKE